MAWIHRIGRSSISRSVRLRELGALAILLAAPLIACESSTSTTDPAIEDFRTCVGNVASNLTQEQRGRVEGAVESIIRAVRGKGAVEFSNKLVRETSDAVNIEIVKHCLTLAQTFPNASPEAKNAFTRAAIEMQAEHSDGPSATMSPDSGLLPARVVISGKHWPPNTELTVTTSDGFTTETVTDRNGYVVVHDVPLGEQARVADQNYATITLQGPDAATAFVPVAYRIWDDPSTSTPSTPETTTPTETSTTSESTDNPTDDTDTEESLTTPPIS